MIPVLVISNIVQQGEIDNIFKVLQYGALDFLPKPQAATANEEELRKTLITKIKVLATKKVSAKPLS
jgi:two-component system chemotaxis response regulator CheB